MRLILLIALTGCTSGTQYYEVDDVSRALVVETLRAAKGQATLTSGERAYLVRPDALRTELTAFTKALAGAVAAQHPPRPVAPDAQPTEHMPVLVFPNFTNALTMGKLAVKSVRMDGWGVHYEICVETRRDHFGCAAVRGTPLVDGAWQRLVARARDQGGPLDRHLMVDSTSNGYIRGVSVDLR